MNKGVLVWGYMASFILLLGAIFMNLNFVAGKVLYLIGFFAFNLGYLIPLFYVIFKENQENKIGIVLVFGVLGFFTFLTGVSFFVINWGGGIVLIYTGGGILILAILSIIALSRRFYETHIDSWFPVLIFGVFIVVSLLTSMVHRQVMRAFNLNNKEAIELLESVSQKNEAIYQRIMELDSLSNSRLGIIQKKSERLVNESKQLNQYIENLKLELIRNVEGHEYRWFDGKTLDNLVPLQSNVEINSVKRFMLRRHGGKAYELKEKLDAFKDSVYQNIPADKIWLRKYISINLNTKTYELSNRHYERKWETENFYELPLVAVLSRLTHLQWRLSVVEGEVLNYYFQEAMNTRFAIPDSLLQIPIIVYK